METLIRSGKWKNTFLASYKYYYNIYVSTCSHFFTISDSVKNVDDLKLGRKIFCQRRKRSLRFCRTAVLSEKGFDSIRFDFFSLKKNTLIKRVLLKDSYSIDCNIWIKIVSLKETYFKVCFSMLLIRGDVK